MKCERALEILISVKNKIEILTSDEEIADLIKFAFISEFQVETSTEHLDKDLNSYKTQFNQLSNEVRNLSKDLIILEGDYSDLGFFSRLFGRGNKLKKEINEIKSQIKFKEAHVSSLKDDILRLNDEIKTIEQAVKVNGKSVFLTPQGELMIDEITARKRYYTRDLQELIDVIKRLDTEFMTMINKVEKIMTRSVFSPIWAVYLINLNMENLTSVFNSITNSDYNYGNSERRMMNLTLNLLKNPNIPLPRSNRQAKNIESQMRYEYGKANIEHQIAEVFSTINTRLGFSIYKIRGARQVISLLGKLFSLWASLSMSGTSDGERYLENFKKIMENRELKLLSDVPNEENLYASLILALSNNGGRYNYFYNLLKDIPEIAKLFSSITTLFPWTPEETWMVLLRAETNILRAQSAKFIPELIEYAILLSMNPRILSIENNLSQEEIDKWKNLIIPAVHLFIFSFLEKDLERYIRRRPLAYIISPMYYRRSALHYYVIG